MKKQYTSPVFEEEKIYITTQILSSNVEQFSSYIDGPGDWGDDPTIDPDDDIIW